MALLLIGGAFVGYAWVCLLSRAGAVYGVQGRYALRLYPADLPHTVALTVASLSPNLDASLDSTVIAPGTIVTLTVTDTGSTLTPGLWYTVPITGTGGGFTRTASVRLLVGGTNIYLPVVGRN